MTKLAVAGLRRSTRKQEDNLSFETQKQAIGFAAERLGYNILPEYFIEEDAVSAYKNKASKRKKLKLMKDLIINNEQIEAVFFYDFSRMDRTAYSFAIEFYYEIKEKRPEVKFFTTLKSEEWTPEDLDVKFNFLLAAAESQTKARQIRDVHHNFLNEAIPKRPGSVTPYGYKMENKILVEDHETSPTVRLIFFLASLGFSMKVIADKLSVANVPSPKGKSWNASTIQKILTNKVYLGHLIWNKGSSNEYYLPNLYENLIPKYLKEFVNYIMCLKEKYGKLDTTFTFNDLVTCKGCRNKLMYKDGTTKKKDKKYHYYYYFCKECNYRIELTELHEISFNEIKQYMFLQINDLPSLVKKSLIALTKGHNKKKQLLQDQLERIKINQNQAVISKDSFLLNATSKVLKKTEREWEDLHVQIKLIESLEDNPSFLKFLQTLYSFPIDKMESHTKRVMAQVFVDDILIDKNCNLEFCYSDIIKKCIL